MVFSPLFGFWLLMILGYRTGIKTLRKAVISAYAKFLLKLLFYSPIQGHYVVEFNKYAGHEFKCWATGLKAKYNHY